MVKVLVSGAGVSGAGVGGLAFLVRGLRRVGHEAVVFTQDTQDDLGRR